MFKVKRLNGFEMYFLLFGAYILNKTIVIRALMTMIKLTVLILLEEFIFDNL